jgi:septum formation protein
MTRDLKAAVVPRAPARAASLVLASASPRRRKVLSEAGVRFEVVVPEVEELGAGPDPAALALENARRKNAWCRSRHPGRHVLSADTVVVLDNACLGKPVDLAQAVEFLQRLSDRDHRVLTASVFTAPGEADDEAVTASTVHFRPLSDVVIREYLGRVDPLDKAGAYDIDQHGSLLIESWAGSWTNIMGLARERVDAWLARHPEFLAP